VLGAYTAYAAAAPDVGTLPAVALTDNQREALIHAYNVETVPFGELRADLTKPVLLARCPFCGIGEASTLDHYLPKELHPQFAVYSRNLIPCCSPCNVKKSQRLFDQHTGARVFLHPYYDTIPELRFLALDVTLHADALGLRYALRRPAQMPGGVFAHLATHFRLLGLADRYRTMSLAYLRDERRALGRFYGSGADAARVAVELSQNAEDHEVEHGPNHWRAVLCRTLSDNQAFCNGGFRILDRIQ
jgi:hypothetical protein